MYSVHNVASFLRTCNSISTRWLLRPPPPAALAAGSSSSLSSFFTIQTCGVATSLYRSSSITQEVSTIASVKRLLSYSSGLTSVTCSAGIPCVRLPPPSVLRSCCCCCFTLPLNRPVEDSFGRLQGSLYIRFGAGVARCCELFRDLDLAGSRLLGSRLLHQQQQPRGFCTAAQG